MHGGTMVQGRASMARGRASDPDEQRLQGGMREVGEGFSRCKKAHARQKWGTGQQ